MLAREEIALTAEWYSCVRVSVTSPWEGCSRGLAERKARRRGGEARGLWGCRQKGKGGRKGDRGAIDDERGRGALGVREKGNTRKESGDRDS